MLYKRWFMHYEIYTTKEGQSTVVNQDHKRKCVPNIGELLEHPSLREVFSYDNVFFTASGVIQRSPGMWCADKINFIIFFFIVVETRPQSYFEAPLC